MSKNLIIFKENILGFPPLISTEDMDAKTWKKEGEWSKDCLPGGRKDKVTNKPFMAYFLLGGFLPSPTGAA